MEELDAELLAVTEPQKRPGRAALSDSSGPEFDGIPDSDNGDPSDDDPDLDSPHPSDASDDDDNDDEFGIDDDTRRDRDYARSKSARPKKKANKKKPPARPKKAKARPKASAAKKKGGAGRQRAAARMPSDDDDESEETFGYRWDKNGYGDDADRDRLLRMNEVERETLLMERVEARNKEYELWKMGRDLKARQSGKAGASAGLRTARSSGRTKASSKSDALQALAEDKRKKSSRLEDVSDADSEGEARSRRDRRDERDRDAKHEEKDEPDLMADDDGPEMRYSDIVKLGKGGERSTTPLFLRRETLLNLSQQPFFARFVVGLFARIRVEGSRYSDDVGSYLLCRIVGVETAKVYDLTRDVRTNYVLVLQIGKQKRPIKLNMTSGSHPSEREFEVYRSRAVDAALEMPRREEVEKLFKKTNALFLDQKVSATDEENKKHIANMELLYPSRVNWTQKRTEARTAVDIKRQELSSVRRKGDSELEDRLKREVEDLERRLSEIESNEAKYGMSGVKSEDVFHGLAERNMALNKANEQLMEKQRNLESEAGGIDPFARFDTTGQSYYSMAKKGEPTIEDAPKEKKRQRDESDWRAILKSWRPDEKRMKISDKPLDPMYAGEIIGVTSFKDISEAAEKKDSFQHPPRVDSVYAGHIRTKTKLPPNAKILAFDEWTRMRGM